MTLRIPQQSVNQKEALKIKNSMSASCFCCVWGSVFWVNRYFWIWTTKGQGFCYLPVTGHFIKLGLCCGSTHIFISILV